MRFAKILLIQSRYDSVFSNVLPLGLGYLSEFLSSRNIENDIFDLNVKKNTEAELHKKIGLFRPELIGFSTMSLNYKSTYRIINNLKDRFPQIPIIMGGAHLSMLREEILHDCSTIDYGAVLEGEYTLLELMEGKEELSAIKGLIHRDRGSIIYNGDRPFIEPLDNLPFPKYTKFKKTDYSSLISIFSSRGCPFECIYCSTVFVAGRRFTARSAKNIVDEIAYHYSQGYREFSFRDDNFTLQQDRVFEICDEIEQRKFKDIFFMCDNGLRADRIDHALLKRMKEVGFRMISIAVESGDARILRIMKKGESLEAIEKAIKLACDLDYRVEIFLLIGIPGETWQDFQKTIEIAIKYPITEASFYHVLPYPNTELFRIAKDNHYLLREYHDYLNDGSQRRNTPFIATPEFPYDLRKKAFDYARRLASRHTKKTRKRHYQKNASEKFKKIGLNDTVALLLAKMYTISFIHDYLFNNRMMLKLKKILRINMIIMRQSVNNWHGKGKKNH